MTTDKYKHVKVIAFDVFNTVVDMTPLPRHEISDYVRHTRTLPWSPLVLPEHWEHLAAHADSIEGINRLRSKYIVVTCSNGPLGMLAKLSKNAGLQWDAIIPLELGQAFKPRLESYKTVFEVLDVEPTEVMMVTANETFGDLKAAEIWGMVPMLIRSKSGPRTITDLADLLGC